MQKSVDTTNKLCIVFNCRGEQAPRPAPAGLGKSKKKRQKMTIKILEIVKAGTTENLMRVPQITVREDGTIWCNKNTTPLLNVSGTLNKTELLPLVEAKTWDKIPADNYLRLGINAGGKECLDQSDVDDRRRENVTPEEEAQIAKAKENARKAREYDRINNEGGEGYNPYRGQAEMEDRTPHHKGDNNPE